MVSVVVQACRLSQFLKFLVYLKCKGDKESNLVPGSPIQALGDDAHNKQLRKKAGEIARSGLPIFVFSGQSRRILALDTSCHQLRHGPCKGLGPLSFEPSRRRMITCLVAGAHLPGAARCMVVRSCIRGAARAVACRGHEPSRIISLAAPELVVVIAAVAVCVIVITTSATHKGSSCHLIRIHQNIASACS